MHKCKTIESTVSYLNAIYKLLPMKIYILFTAALLSLAACNYSGKGPANKQLADTATAKTDTVKLPVAFIKDAYAKSDLVAKIKVNKAVKAGEIYVIDAALLETYKGKATSNFIKYEAFLEEGSYQEFLNKELIIFLKANTRDSELLKKGIQ